jgi:hypothetical protein
MAGKQPPSEEELRAELRKQGVDNFGELVSEAARRIKARGDVEAQWYILGGDQFVFIVREPWD